ncbi:YdeI/OmpD-associated family protein [Micromonospora sp. NPDC049230]|uniref:YdeI/OmpD-associated family protein n=1 Tax=Micromonospora sp. NPDC049230 TaxID=3155502 RepID=UPI0033EA6A41
MRDFPDAAAWEAWLATQHEVRDEAWLRIAKVEALTAAGRMRPAGLREVAAARADGRWEAAYEGQRTATTPPDLLAALSADPRASAAFERLGRSARYAVILPVLRARTPETRAKVLAREVARLTR